MPPTLTSFAVLQQLVRKYFAEYKLDGIDDAFGWVVLGTILNLNEVEITEAIVDEGNDGGIDAVQIIDNDVHLFSYTYTEKFANAASNFPQNKLDNLIVTTDKIMTRTLVVDDVNAALWEKIESIWRLSDDSVPHFHFHICSNKEHPTEQAQRRFEDSLNAYRFVDFNYVSLEDIVTLLLDKRRTPIDREINFIDLEYFPKADAGLRATVANIAATDLVEIIRDPDDDRKINEEVFNENVRVDLGRENTINRGIFESALADSNYEFWYLNNGITIVCDECNYVPNSRSPRVTLRNLQIVNGGQTTRAIFHAYHDNLERIRHVEILVRIIETRDRSISERISESANRQTPIRTRDLRANDWIQRKLAVEFEQMGFWYERKRNQHTDQPVETRLDAELLGQLALAFYDMPSEAKNQKSTVFGDLYQYVFAEDTTTAEWLLLPYMLYKPLEELKREMQGKKRRKEQIPDGESFVSLATFHILNAMKLVAAHEGTNLRDPDVADVRSKAITLVGEVVRERMTELGELYTHDRFFKQKETNEIVKNYILQQYAK